MALTDKELFNEVIKTPEFQRLKKIKQLGFCPEANHTRYDHSIGVYERAKEFLSTLEKNSDIKIDVLHKRCVIMAGLLHDIGHGPFSHFWEQEGGFKHEQNGLRLVKKIFSKIRLSEEDHDYGVRLIQALIQPIDESGTDMREQFNGIDQFLFEIINNQTCYIDVDRFDYLMRDWDNVSNKIQFNSEMDDVESLLENVKKFMEGAKISEDRQHILYNNEGQRIHAMFKLRLLFHRNIYQTRRVKITEHLLRQMIKLVKNDINTSHDITKIDSNYDEFLNLDDDSVWKWIEESNNAKVKYYLEAYKNYDTRIQVFNEPTANSFSILTKYKYVINSNIRICLVEDNWIDQEYSFEDKFYYSITE